MPSVRASRANGRTVRGLAILAALACALPAWAEAGDLERQVEGRRVAAPVDLSAIDCDIDVDDGETPSWRDPEHHKRPRLCNATRAGDTAQATGLHLTRDALRVERGGGGFGVVNQSSFERPPPRSERELELERQLQKESWEPVSCAPSPGAPVPRACDPVRERLDPFVAFSRHPFPEFARGPSAGADTPPDTMQAPATAAGKDAEADACMAMPAAPPTTRRLE